MYIPVNCFNFLRSVIIDFWYIDIEEDFNIDKLESDIYNTIRKYKYPNWEADN